MVKMSYSVYLTVSKKQDFILQSKTLECFERRPSLPTFSAFIVGPKQGQTLVDEQKQTAIAQAMAAQHVAPYSSSKWIRLDYPVHISGKSTDLRQKKT